MVDRPPARVAAGRLLPLGLQRATCAGSPHLAEQESALQAPVRRQRSDPAGSRRRSETPRRGDRIPERPAYLGANAATASPHSLRRTRWGTLAGSPQVDSRAQSLLSSGQGFEPGVSWKVRGGVETRFPSE